MQGATGEVRLALRRETGQRYALKIVRKHMLGPLGRDARIKSAVLNEAKVLQRLNHPCVIRMHVCWSRVYLWGMCLC